MDGFPSATMEVLNQPIDDLAQDNFNDLFMSTGIRTEIRELQERIDSPGSFPAFVTVHLPVPLQDVFFTYPLGGFCSPWSQVIALGLFYRFSTPSASSTAPTSTLQPTP